MGGVGTAERTTVARRPQAELAQVVELILDKGLVIDVDARISLVGLELISIRARIVVASVDTYLRYAEAVDRMEKAGNSGTPAGGSPGKGLRKRDVAAGVLAGGKEWLEELREERRARRKGTR